MCPFSLYFLGTYPDSQNSINLIFRCNFQLGMIKESQETFPNIFSLFSVILGLHAKVVEHGFICSGYRQVVLKKNVETFFGWISNYLDSWPVPKLVLHSGEILFTFTLCILPLLLKLSYAACSCSSLVLPLEPHLINVQF